VAIYYLRMKTFGRSRGKHGSRAPSAAAYRSGERIRDERTGHVYDHRRRADVLHKEIILPTQLAAQGTSLGWARDRTTLWNAAEHAESRRNSRVAREFVVALPHELAPAARVQLASRFAQEIADRYRSAVDLAIHTPRGDARNFHAHLLATTREITPEGLGRKTSLELSGTQRHELGLLRWREEIGSIRERWANLTNAALERAHIATRVTHLSAAERGLGPSDAPPRVPIAAYHIEKRGERSFIAERIRERHRADLERAQAQAGRQAPELRDPEQREPGLPSSHRIFGAIGRSMLREIGASVAAAWRGLHERFDAHRTAERPASAAASPESSRTPAPSLESRAIEQRRERERERSHRIPTLGELRAAAIERGWGGDEATLKSARNWLVYREKQRAQEAAGLEAGTGRSGRDGATESRARDASNGRRLGSSLEREHVQGRGNDFSL
jgi:MobA/MobL family